MNKWMMVRHAGMRCWLRSREHRSNGGVCDACSEWCRRVALWAEVRPPPLRALSVAVLRQSSPGQRAAGVCWSTRVETLAALMATLHPEGCLWRSMHSDVTRARRSSVQQTLAPGGLSTAVTRACVTNT